MVSELTELSFCGGYSLTFKQSIKNKKKKITHSYIWALLHSLCSDLFLKNKAYGRARSSEFKAEDQLEWLKQTIQGNLISSDFGQRL